MLLEGIIRILIMALVQHHVVDKSFISRLDLWYVPNHVVPLRNDGYFH